MSHGTNESGVYVRTQPPPAMPANDTSAAPTVPAPRDRVAEFKALYLGRREDLRRYDAATEGMARLAKELAPDEHIALDRWLGTLGD